MADHFSGNEALVRWNLQSIGNHPPNASQTLEAPASISDHAWNILHLEDSPDDRFMIQSLLQEQDVPIEIVAVDNQADFAAALGEKCFDVILSDMTLPGFDGMTALRFAREKCPEIPFVFVTGSMGEEAAIDTMRDGATDYVLKDRLSRLVPALKRAIGESKQKQKSRQIEEKNREQAALLDKAQDAILVKDMGDCIQYWNKSAERIYGWAAEEMIGRKAEELLSKDATGYTEAQKELLRTGKWKGELLKVNRGGAELTVESHWTLVCDESGNPKSVFMIDTDITEKKGIEAKFLRSQRMDSIGALAGGIAHDLNNALAPVIMGSELLRDCENKNDRERFLDIIHSNAIRATDLVKQILSFARGSSRQSGPVKLLDLIGEMSRMIQDTFPKNIAFSARTPGKSLWTVRGDATEIHQVFLNLCINARDAMPKGGSLTLLAENFMLDSRTATAFDAKPGRYVMISIADTGTGIPPDVLPRIFEPFFTTKIGGKGTGLGLATAGGIVKHHGGFMDIDTEAGKGTEFKIYLPAVEFLEDVETEHKQTPMPAGHGELIFVIDDEQTLLELTKTMLENFGYQALTAQDGLQGIARFREHQNEIKLVITDSDMPHLDGRGVIRAIKELQPNMPVIMASGTKGNATEEFRRSGFLRVKTLEKPYSLEQLLTAVDSGLRV
jgi:two-component system cell cycle sensor histidine kinase/response regulator CckA